MKDIYSHLEQHALSARAGKNTTATDRAEHATTQIRAVQSALATHGYDPGVRHGALDLATRDALVKFQRGKGLHITGTIDKPTAIALRGAPRGGAGTAPALGSRATTQGTKGQETNMQSRGKYWQSKVKRVPVIFAQTLGGSATSPSTSTANFSVNPQMAFRGENLVIDAVTGALCTVTIPTVGSNPMIAGGTAGASIPGAMFPPTQTDCIRFAMDIAQQGNQLAFTASNSQTSLSLNFVALVFGTEAEEVDEKTASGVAPAALWSGVAPASSWSGR